MLQCQQGTLISSCRVRFSCGGYCAQVCLGTKAGFPDAMLSACRLQSSGARLSHSLLSGHWYDAPWPKTERKTHKGVAFGGSQTATATASTISYSVSFVPGCG